MARNQAIEVDNNFSKGLITENTALNFPKDACTEAVNCVFDETGRVFRRKPIDLEEEFQFLGLLSTAQHDDVCSEYLWTDVAGLGTVSFLVQQVGNRIYIFDASTNTDLSKNQKIILSLDTVKASGTPNSPRTNICQYAQGNGHLIVTNRACDPFYIAYNVTTDTFGVSRITVQYRDFIGIDDGYTSRTRPGFATITDMVNDVQGAKHYYNLLNQGWWQGGATAGAPSAASALGQWDTAFANMPSNNDAVAYFRASPSDALDSARVNSYEQGNTPAPKGHFLLTVGNADRYTALTSDAYSLTFTGTKETYVDATTGIIFGKEPAIERDYLFDDNTSGAAGNTFQTVVTGTSLLSINTYGGKNWPAAKEITKVNVYASKISGSWQFGTYDDSFTGVNNIPMTTLIEVYGSNTPPTSYNNGTLLGSKAVSTGTVSTTIPCTTGTSYTHHWVAISKNFAGPVTSITRLSLAMSEIKFYENVSFSAAGALPDADVTAERFQCCAFFASRAWYAGVEETSLSNNIYFSQIIVNTNQYGRCYQNNDPTSEILFDILPTDGGVIKIPEMGKVYKLYPYQTSLLIFASNGVWLIGSSNGFTATDYYVRKISSLGTSAPMSFVDVKGTPAWWGEEGIFQINYNPQFDSFSVENISENTIRTFFYNIPADKRNNVKGAYDIRDGVVYWLYDDRTENQVQAAPTYTKALCLNIKSGAYYPLEFGLNDAVISGLCYVQDSVGVAPPKVKFTVLHNATSTQIRLYYADLKDTTVYTDWVDFADAIDQPTQAMDYDSYFITGYKLNGETMKYIQPNYVSVFLEAQTNAGVYIQGVFDFTTSGNSGKWSSRQQCYNSSLTNRSIISRRIKVRGKGRSVQYKFSNEGSKPFTIIGWSTFQTANAGL